MGLFVQSSPPRYEREDHILFYVDEAGKYGPSVEDSFTGFAVSGRVGAGKSKFAIKALAQSMWLAGYGTIHACPKPDTFKETLGWANEIGVGDRVIEVAPDGKNKFSLMSWMATRFEGRAIIREAVDILRDVSEAADRGRMTNAGDGHKFFDAMADRWNGAAMAVDLASNGKIDTARCLKLMQMAPDTLQGAQSPENECVKECAKALRNASDEQLEDVRIGVDFLLQEMASQDPRTRSNCIVSATVLWSKLLEYPLNMLFGEPGNFTPECILDGAIVCINVPLSMGSPARLAFILHKLCLQKLLLGRIQR